MKIVLFTKIANWEAMRMEIKYCSRCKQNKSPIEFNKHAGNKNGLQHWCKSCTSIYAKEYSQTSIGRAKNRKHSRMYKSSPKGAVTRQCYENREDVKLKRYLYIVEYRKQNPEKSKARRKVQYAIEKGSLPKASSLECVGCGNKAHEYHHYKGYESKHWLDVEPICKKCHIALHPQIPIL